MEKQMKLHTIRQSAKLIDGFTEYQIRKLVKGGTLPHIKSGNRVLIEERTIFEYITRTQNNEVRSDGE